MAGRNAMWERTKGLTRFSNLGWDFYTQWYQQELRLVLVVLEEHILKSLVLPWMGVCWTGEVTGGRRRKKTCHMPDKRRCGEPLWRKQQQRISPSYKHLWDPAGQALSQHSNAISILFYCFWRAVLASSPCRRYKATWTPSGRVILEQKWQTPTRCCDVSGGLALFLLKTKGDLLVTNVCWNRGHTWLCDTPMGNSVREAVKRPLST